MKPEPTLNVSTEAVKNLLIDAYKRYNQAFDSKDPDHKYWDGYIRALHHVLEMEYQ